MGIERTLCWDLDGVVIDLVSEVWKHVNKLLRIYGYRTNYGFNDQRSWGAVSEIITELTKGDYRQKEIVNACDMLFTDCQVVRDAKPHFGARSTLRILHLMGYGQRVVSGRPESNKQVTTDWLHANNIGFLTNNIIVCRREEKSGVINEIKPFLHHDDDTQVIGELNGMGRLVLRPWNESGRNKFPRKIHRKDWNRIFIGIIMDDIRSRVAKRMI